MELSHRGKEFASIIEETESDLRELIGIPDSYAVLFSTGGATKQFSMVPLNLLTPGSTADYINTGVWSKKAIKEAQKFGELNIAASSEAEDFRQIPKEISPTPNSAYLHFTSNNTIYGTQFKEEPLVDDATLVCDASSDILSKPIDVSKYGLIYAGAQKNMGTSGVTVVIMRKELLERSKGLQMPALLNYNTLADSSSLFNTPPTFSIYVVSEVLKWIKASGGTTKIAQRNEEKAQILYDTIDELDSFEGYAAKEDRSLMNVVFTLKNKEHENTFFEGALKHGLSGLKGHRSVGGARASIYNAFPLEGVRALANYMREFATR